VLRSLSSRLIAAFAVVIALCLVVAGVGSLFLLRDQQEEAAEERVGRLAEPITLGVALMELADLSEEDIADVLDGYARRFDVRILLLDKDGRVVTDTEAGLTGETIAAFERLTGASADGDLLHFRKARYRGDEGNLLLFASGREGQLMLGALPLEQLQSLIFSSAAAGLPLEDLESGLATLQLDPEGQPMLGTARYVPVVAVPEGEITSAWLDLAPRLAIAAVVALLASAVVALIISRSISGRLSRITRAAQEMAKGQYDQEISIYGRDEVGRLAEAFNQMAREVSRSHRSMRDLLANVSHELKTPLTSIQGFSQAMVEGETKTAEEFAESGLIINEEARRMRSLVEDLLYLSQMEAGHLEMQREPVDMEDLLRTCAERFRRQVQESGAQLKLDLHSLPAVEGDEHRLEQAFSNLVDNAVRHTPSGGTITLRARAANGLVRVTVHNTGSFIPSEDLSRVFERFFQVDRNRGRRAGHSGLGLSIAAEVVQAHRGTIEASSSRESGTEFTVILPLADGIGPGGRSENESC
jgi:signal transduction histidine kinase